MSAEEELITQAYRAFNARDVEAVLAALSPQVLWANGMEGGYLHGQAAVREYWERQWQVLDPHVEPRRIHRQPDGRFQVTVHQVVRDRAGTLLADQEVLHVYTIENGLIQRMDILNSPN